MRKMQKIHCQVDGGVTNALMSAQEIEQWLLSQAQPGEVWLLVHAGDGVVWGKIEDQQLHTSVGRFNGAVPGTLNPRLLQQCRVFGPESELRLWRVGEAWHWQRRRDGATGHALEALDESYILWGTKVEAQEQGFSLMADGAQGLRHAVPLTDIRGPKGLAMDRPLRLLVRHYIAEHEEDGTLYITGSRLRGVAVEER